MIYGTAYYRFEERTSRILELILLILLVTFSDLYSSLLDLPDIYIKSVKDF